jgi:hypothetical protein
LSTIIESIEYLNEKIRFRGGQRINKNKEKSVDLTDIEAVVDKRNNINNNKTFRIRNRFIKRSIVSNPSS